MPASAWRANRPLRDGTERQLVAAAKQLQVTKVIVAHRPETIASVDRVLVMHGGKIVQEIRPEPVQVAA